MDDQAADDPRASHAALFYRTPEEFTAAASDYLHAGLIAGEAVFVASAGSHADLLRSLLGPQRSPSALADLAECGANPGRVLSMLRMFAGEHRGRAVRCVQDQYWPGRPLEEVAEAMRHEALVGMALAGTGVSLLCAYDTGLDPDLLAMAEAAHPVLVREGHWLHSALFRGAGPGPQPDEPLSSPPVGAAELLFRDEQSAVRRFVASQAERACLAENRVRDLVIAAAELAANTLLHTDGPGRLTMWTADGEVICQVSDTGRIADPLVGTVRPDPASTDRRRGLWLVHQLGDLVQIRSGSAGTTVRVHMRLGSWPSTAGLGSA